MAVKDLFRGQPANRERFGVSDFPPDAWSHASRHLLVHLPTEDPRFRLGRLLADRLLDEIRYESRIRGVWLHQSGGETIVTVVAERLDQELEFRLHDAFEALAGDLVDRSVGELFLYDADTEIPGGAPLGEELLSATTESAGSPQPS